MSRTRPGRLHPGRLLIGLYRLCKGALRVLLPGLHEELREGPGEFLEGFDAHREPVDERSGLGDGVEPASDGRDECHDDPGDPAVLPDDRPTPSEAWGQAGRMALQPATSSGSRPGLISCSCDHGADGASVVQLLRLRKPVIRPAWGGAMMM
jgi:hypothetical protein